ncbi:head-tail connector protein [Haematobacter genomosp. 1]|uniref:Phage gp6-like head-tail connector protein n=1 Tax=Haematobacter genomosp. 1 TaxID=366618 RepID=A0A212ACE7_9RHOB|nr:head-tail connector protein [Haematobacter genomosp. 1]OWJ78548.1 hypothetical protein CDV49_09000 [Haematobacter genomosp. 1]
MISLDEAKLHLRITEDDLNAEIVQMIAAATDHLASIGITSSCDPVPPAVKRAALLLVDHFFQWSGRMGDDTAPPFPPVINRLIAPYREIAL